MGGLIDLLPSRCGTPKLDIVVTAGHRRCNWRWAQRE
jgi:hypothetical protein